MKRHDIPSRNGMTTMLMRILLVSTIARAPSQTVSGNSAGRPFAEAERLFRADPRWLGADGALSVPISEGRILWLFGDTFVATSNAHLRTESEMLRNTVAIQTRDDPRTASIAFHWRQDSDGSPASFFPERGDTWYWPGHGILLDEGPLIIFLYSIVATAGHGLGFVSRGYALAVIDNPTGSPETWDLRIIDAPPITFDTVPATAVIREDAYVVAVAIRQEGTHAGPLDRYPVTSLARGDATAAEWWTGNAEGWIPASSLGERAPAFVLDDAGSECSLHWNERTRSFVHVASYGFGASMIGMRTAQHLTGPWSSPRSIYHPPESDGPRPFVFAAKAHPAFSDPNAADLIVNFATNSFEFRDLLTQAGMRILYWPRFVVVPVGK